MTRPVRTLANAPKHFPVSPTGVASTAGSARIAAYRRLPEVLAGLGVELRDVMDAAGLPAGIFDDPDTLVAYADLGRLMEVSAQLSNCDHIALLMAQGIRLADMGLAGEVAFCGENAGDGLQRFVRYFTLQNTAATLNLITSDGLTRFLYAIAGHKMVDTRHFQLGALTVAFNVLQDLCGPKWLPAAVTIASKAPSNLRPCQNFFRAPLSFNSDQSAIFFESHWLDRPLPQADPSVRAQIESRARERQAALMTDFPATVRRLLRKQVVHGECSMDCVAAICGVHRRALHRMLQRHGVLFSEILESVQSEVACQLLRDTGMPVQQIAESLRYSSAANFATAFRHWTGVTPTEYRRSASRRSG
ncbi:MAG: AraC family transcriptional regulator ligand-binding domain-containing protein [Steroidobacteraceae bacterium]